MKTFLKIVSVFAAVLLLYGLAAAALNIIFNDTGWLYKEYLDELGFRENEDISPEDASRVLARMMYYAIGRADDLDVTIEEDGEEVPFFNQREIDHMKDVRKLAISVMISGAVSLALSLITLILLFVFKQKDAIRTFAKAYLIAFGAVVLAVIALAVWMLIDFDSFWTMFHVVFLDLESSTFDPVSSRMIRICPPELFGDFIGSLGNYAAFFAGGAAVFFAVYLAVTGRKKKNKAEGAPA